MRSSMNAWPEVIFIDGTYKLLKSDLTVMLVAVEDSIGATEIVGVGLLVNEDANSMRWFLDMFKKDHESACARIKCFMSDKDRNMRAEIERIFGPDIVMYLCLFHTQQTFKREITVSKRKISTEDKEVCLEYLQMLAYSQSLDEYDELYQEFSKVAPTSVKNYFDTNWHECRHQWTVYSMISCNLGNRTNNRVESLNAQANALIKKRSTLPDFVVQFFFLLESQKTRVAVRVAKNFTSMPTKRLYVNGSVEHSYMKLLTEIAAQHVLKELKAHIRLTPEKHDDKTITFISEKYIESNASISSCNCIFSLSFMLPCRHIFFTREHFKVSLYDETLCAKRWTNNYCIDKQRCFEPQDTEVINGLPPTITTISCKTIQQDIQEKQRVILAVKNSLISICSLCCENNFTRKVEVLKKINDSWNRDLKILTEEKTEEGFSKLQNQTGKKKSNILSVPRKRQLVTSIIKPLIDTEINPNNINFEERIKILKIIENLWRNQIDVTVVVQGTETALCGDFNNQLNNISDHSKTSNHSFSDSTSEEKNYAEWKRNIEERLRKLQLQTLSTNNTSDQKNERKKLSSIQMPNPIKIIGRPRDFETTWLKTSAKKT